MPIEPGTRVGPYEVLSPIGSGGMGEVYRARDPQLGRELALKVLPEQFSRDEEQLHRFEQEARSASLLNHPSIVTIYDVGRMGDRPYIAMELVAGQTLRQLLDEAFLTPRRALPLAIRIAGGLAAAHSRGIVHRDLKPDNIMVLDDQRVKILDFGLAKLTGHDLEGSDADVTARITRRRTAPGTILGTIGYMSPEQASGDPADFRSDQFAFGVILYELLTGLRPFQRPSSLETLHAIIRDEVPPLREVNPEVPERISIIVERLLSKEPADRYAATADLVRDLELAQQSVSISGPAAPVRRISRRTRAWVGAGLIAVLLLAAGAVGLRMRSAHRAAIPERKSLAVLPFTDLSGQPNGQLYSRGVSETVSARLASLSGLQVMPPAAANDIEKSAMAVAKELGATLILHGAVQRAGDMVKINYALINASDGVQLAADSVSGLAADVFLLQEELADRVVRALQLQTSGKSPGVDAGLPSSADQDRYLQALGLLQRYDREADIDQAVRSLEELRSRSGDSAMVHAALGRAYLYKYRLVSDAVWLERALEASSRAATIDPERGDVRVTLGEIRLARGDFKEAIGEFERALSHQPNSPDAMLGLALAYRRSGRPRETEETYKRTIALSPGWWAPYNHLGVLYLREGRYQEAVSMFRKVIELTPDNVRGYNNLGGTYQHMGKVEDALEAYRRSVAIRPNGDALANQALLLYFAGRYGEAAAALERATALTPNDHQLWMNLGDAYRWTEGGRDKAGSAYDRAIVLANRALAANEKDASAHVTLAVSHAKRGHPELSSKHLRRALELDPADAGTLYVAGVVSNVAGRREDALRYLGESVKGGWPRDQLLNEPDLASLKRDADFQKLLEQAGG
jgi:serine/threonine protein kinase/tetratricopeptide (TPR) repeat protein